MAYQPPLQSIQFALHDVLDVAGVLTAHGVPIDRETIDGVVSGAAEFCTGVTAPLNAVGDREGCQLNDGVVRTPSGFPAAAKKYVEAGWPAVTCREDDGGAGLPHVVGTVISEILSATNAAWSLYFGLTGGAYRCLRANGTTEQRRLFLPKLAAGEWTGTMCLTEPHCGTDLGLLTTKAVPQDDGTYLITGTKMFISGGDNDFADNIVHLVLARVEGAPSGTRGISLFVVPKNHVTSEGEVGGRNGVYCDSIEEKMGMHGNATCLMRFDNAVGELVGERERGLPAMFVMMNGARLGTATQALGLTESAQQQATAYARDRLQSRAPGVLHDKNRVADPIIDQPDVRRMVLTQKAWAGGARLFAYWMAMQIDLEHGAHDADVRRKAGDILALLTPVAKAFVTDRAIDTTTLAMQTFGGAGYIVESGIEQTYRDGRILAIYEGTNGVQAHDLLARKVIGDDGVRLRQLTNLVRSYTGTPDHSSDLAAMHARTRSLADEVDTLAGELIARAADDPLSIGTSAADFLNLVGYLVYAHLWARAAATVDALGEGATGHHRQQAAIARFYFDKLLPDTRALLERARSSSAVLMDRAAIGI
ncbi:acyl-CoA dehydrogenase [Cumulibacter manganitolerans]|uniref:acyl-CoA dehydrogenase n=1 Tax=Cumulibacter manganitolerans TaxID=1884992 RepID=UPI001297FB4D|nr:acyl-CoA dehydrogenase [Cumulibacter manganitolerans]